jgi:hypothetical protein
MSLLLAAARLPGPELALPSPALVRVLRRVPDPLLLLLVPDLLLLALALLLPLELSVWELRLLLVCSVLLLCFRERSWSNLSI